MNCPKCGTRIPDDRFAVAKNKAKASGLSRAFEPWTPEEDKIFAELWLAGWDILELQDKMKRNASAFARRADMLELSPTARSNAILARQRAKEFDEASKTH